MSTVKMSPKTEAAVQAAVGLAHVTAKADGAIPVSPDSVVALVTEAVEHAEQILRGGAVKEAAEKEAAEKEKEVGGPNPVVNALRHAAVCLLDDCTTQCQREATLVPRPRRVAGHRHRASRQPPGG